MASWNNTRSIFSTSKMFLNHSLLLNPLTMGADQTRCSPGSCPGRSQHSYFHHPQISSCFLTVLHMVRKQDKILMNHGRGISVLCKPSLPE